jgi:hypothetical protein
MDIIILSAVAVAGLLTAILHRYFIKDDILEDTSIRSMLGELPRLIRGARRSIKIATDFEPTFFDDERVRTAIAEALANKVQVEFLSERDPPEWYKEQQGIKIKQVKGLPYHLWVIDAHHVRFERPHGGRQFGTEREDIGLVLEGFPKLGSKHEERFEELWQTSS